MPDLHMLWLYPHCIVAMSLSGAALNKNVQKLSLDHNLAARMFSDIVLILYLCLLQLHWLPIGVQFKMGVSTIKALN